MATTGAQLWPAPDSKSNTHGYESFTNYNHLTAKASYTVFHTIQITEHGNAFCKNKVIQQIIV
jgi:hypothetical protein